MKTRSALVRPGFSMTGAFMDEKRVGFVGIIVKDRKKNAAKVNEILTEFGDIMVGRIGLPYRERGVGVIAVIVDGSMDDIGSLAGKLGMLEGVTVKSSLAKQHG